MAGVRVSLQAAAIPEESKVTRATMTPPKSARAIAEGFDGRGVAVDEYMWFLQGGVDRRQGYSQCGRHVVRVLVSGVGRRWSP
jgi:hypothetical protein